MGVKLISRGARLLSRDWGLQRLPRLACACVSLHLSVVLIATPLRAAYLCSIVALCGVEAPFPCD